MIEIWLIIVFLGGAAIFWLAAGMLWGSSTYSRSGIFDSVAVKMRFKHDPKKKMIIGEDSFGFRWIIQDIRNLKETAIQVEVPSSLPTLTLKPKDRASKLLDERYQIEHANPYTFKPLAEEVLTTCPLYTWQFKESTLTVFVPYLFSESLYSACQEVRAVLLAMPETTN